jgi:hypothetical protein
MRLHIVQKYSPIPAACPTRPSTMAHGCHVASVHARYASATIRSAVPAVSTQYAASMRRGW